MKLIGKKFIDRYALDPKKLFLIDGIGALLSAFFLGIVLTFLETFFGMPKHVLYFLALMALSFCVYSVSCYFFAGNSWRILLKIIAFINSIYCCLTIGLVVIFYEQLTVLGVMYFILELIIVMGLITVEFVTAYRQNPS